MSENAQSGTDVVCCDAESVLAVVPPRSAPEDTGPVFEDDFVLPRRTIVQPTSGVGTPGRIRCSVTGEEKAEARLAILRLERGRVLWPTEIGQDPECKSLDGMYPAHSIEHPKAEVCTVAVARRLRPVCPMAMWGPKNERPPCRDTYAAICLDIESETPFLMSFAGMGLRSVRVLRTVAYQRKLSLFDVSATLRLRRLSNGRGSFYVPDFVDFHVVQPLGKYREPFERFRGYDVQATFDSESNGNGNGKDVAADDRAC
jgi:hypothetical protein